MPHLFCYGSLMFTPVWSRVVEGAYECTKARVRGFQRRGVEGKSYPCLIPGSQEDVVTGLLYFHINAADLARVDIFEGDLYDRQTVTCGDVDDQCYGAEAYVLKTRHRSVVTSTEWDETWFATEGLAQFFD